MKVILSHLKENGYKYVFEILVIILGILGAFALDNWNEYRKTQIIEKEYLIDLQDEFNYNHKELERAIEGNISTMERALMILKQIGRKNNKISEQELAEHIWNAIMGEQQYQSRTSVLTELMISGNLKLISNKKLKNLLASLDAKTDGIRIQEEWVDLCKRDCNDYIMKMGSHRRIYDETNKSSLYGLEKGKKRSSNIPIIQSEIFENYLLRFIGSSNALKEIKYNPFKEDIQHILSLIKVELIE